MTRYNKPHDNQLIPANETTKDERSDMKTYILTPKKIKSSKAANANGSILIEFVSNSS